MTLRVVILLLCFTSSILNAEPGAALQKLDEIGTGKGPKSLMFTPDGRFMITALLFGNGVEVYTVDPLRHAKTVTLDENATGFVELAYNDANGEVWVTQMLTDTIHVIDAHTFEPLRTFDSGGVWPKVIAFSPDKDTAYVSHWRSLDVSVIDMATGKASATIPVPGIPRGLAVSQDGDLLYVANFSIGGLEIVDMETNRVTWRIETGKGALRHVILDAFGKTAFGSDMYRGRVVKVDLNELSVSWSERLASNPNTIALSPDGKYLFVSCRGKNNEKNWHEKGPEHGKIFMLDTVTLETVDWIWGGNQPTGLAVSMDGAFLTFSNFYDDTIELYRIEY